MQRKSSLSLYFSPRTRTEGHKTTSQTLNFPHYALFFRRQP
jgi:hypothetical protein